MTFIFADGCKVPLDYLNTERTLDICNCSTYYITTGLLDKTRHTCPQDQLWNHKVGICEDTNRILSERLCNRKYPWERCSKDTQASKKLQIRDKCIREGRYSEAVGSQYDDKLSYQSVLALPNDIVFSNLELAAAAFVAGCVVTLVLLAIILTMCKLQGIGMLNKKTSSTRSVTKKKKSTRHAVTEGDNVSIQYEDIDEEMQPTQQGYKPMFSGAHLQLQGDTFQDSHVSHHQHQSSSSVMTSSSTNHHWSTETKPPTKPLPIPPSRALKQPTRPVPFPSQTVPSSKTEKISRVEIKVKTPPKLPIKPPY